MKASLTEESSADRHNTHTHTGLLLPDVDEALPPPARRDEDQTGQRDDQADGRLRCSGMVSLHEGADQGWARKAAERDPRKPSPHASQAERSFPAHQPPAPCPGSLSQDVCVLSLSQVSELASPHSALAGSPRGQCSQASLVVSLASSSRAAGRDDSVDSGVSSSGSVPRAGTPDDPQPRGVEGRVAALEVGGLDCRKSRMNPASVPASASVEADPIHPDHQQFEEEEEELEEIWTRTPGLRQSICSDIMYQPHQEEEEEGGSPLATPREPPSPRTQPGLYRKLVTASAPNLMVAEFTLPSSGQHSPRAEPPALGKRDRRSWAAFPDQQQPCKPSALVNETAADRVKLPDIQDQKIYIYQYKEEEEEEEDEGTACLKVRSTLDCICLLK